MSMPPQDAWLATLGQLQMQLHSATYDTWVREAQFVSFEDGLFTISVPNDYARDWLTKRLYRLIQHTLSNVFQDHVELTFITTPKERTPRTLPESPLFPSDTGRPGEPVAPVSVVVPVRDRKPEVIFAEGEHLNEDYSLANFVVGHNNRLAHSAALAITESVNHPYNPLFIHSQVGLGKTHLLNAIGLAFQTCGLKIVLVSAETFTNDFVRAVRMNQMDAFRNYYRGMDALLIDDIQFIAGKESTQEEFFHTFNAIYKNNGQIVVTAKAPPSQIDLEERLSSRLGSGLEVELHAPAFECRVAILQRKARAQETEMPEDVAAAIASRTRGSVRDLEGVLNKVLAQSALTRQQLSATVVEHLLKDHQPEAPAAQIEIDDILETTARYHQLTLDDLLSKQRSSEVSLARHIAIYLARNEINATLPAIGRALGGRSHSTILNGYRKVEKLIQSDPALRRNIDELRKQIHEQNAV
jgi:chromosomal replication initiator protein